MGYTTDFDGQFMIAPPLTKEQQARYADMIQAIWDRKGPEGTPDSFCKWVPTDDGAALEHDGGEKFYEYEAWLRWLVENVFTPIGRTVYGSVTWQGEDLSDRGVLSVVNGHVRASREKDRKPDGDSVEERFAFLADGLKSLIVALDDDAAIEPIQSLLKKVGVEA